MINIKARILKILNGGMTALLDDKIIECVPSGNAKKQKIVVGDLVIIEENTYGEKYVVKEVLERKNKLIRPTLANLDQLFIIISKSPKPDFLLIDKLLVYCNINNILPYIIINKIDLYESDEIQKIKDEYFHVVEDVIEVSAKQGKNIDKIIKLLSGKVSAFSGQSAVGKSTLLNAISPKLKLATNGLSVKINRGKHTTRHSEIFVLDDVLIADTPGFSLLDLNLDIIPETLAEYCPDFVSFCKCKYTNCDHTNLKDKDCSIAKAVNEGSINENRYDRYVQLYKIVKEKWRKKYD